MTEVKFKLFSWDWKDQPDWAEINDYIAQQPGRIFFHEIVTGTDCYAVLIADKKLLPEEAQLLSEPD